MELISIALATIASLGRVLALILLSIVSGWFLAYFAVRSRKFENIFVSSVNIFESIPVIGFLPIVLVVFISGLGGTLGVEVAADFLVFDAIVWNIWIGQYQAYKTVPQPLVEVSENYNFGWLGKMKSLYIPFSYPRVSSDIFPSFADALFYIMISEVFSVGVTSYKVFGIGTLIVQATSVGDLNSMYECLGVLAIGVVVITLAFGNFSKYAVAKYGLNTPTEIKRYMRYWRPHIRRWHATATPTFQYSIYTTKMRRGIENIQMARVRANHSFERTGKYIGTAIAGLFLIFIGYSSIQVILSVPHSQWISYFAQTPNLLYQMGVDYIRVLAVTLVSFVFAISLGYYLAVHRRISLASLPIIQTISAFPAPAYFPLVFAAIAPFLAHNAIPFAETEIFVMILCFLSTFYYVFFGLWVGVRAIPVEFLELTQNYKIGFFTKMRRIIIPATFPYLVTGISSTINSAWGGLAVAEYWPHIFRNQTLQVHTGMMKVISTSMVNGNIGLAAWTSLLFAVVVGVYAIVFTRNLMDLARKKYVIEEGIYAA